MIQHEDIVWKHVFELLKDDGLSFFGINEQIIAEVNTEQIAINKRIGDKFWLTDNDSIIHLEFQSRKTDISRFLVTDAMLIAHYGKSVRTVVIYSADILSAESSLAKGSIRYSVENIYMAKFNGDDKYEQLAEKVNKKEPLERQDIMTVVLLPLMQHKDDTATIIEKAIDLAINFSEDEQTQALSMIYLLADKFVTNISRLERIKERIAMTKLGEMILQDGRKDGARDKAIEVAIRLLKRGYSTEDIAEDTDLDIATIEALDREMNK